MHILFVTRGSAPPSSPLMGVFEMDQARALARQGCRISYLSLDLRSIRRKRKLGFHYYVKDNIEIYELAVPIGALPRSVFTFIGRVCAVFLFKKVLKFGEKPDVIHSHFADMGDIALCLKNKYKIPLVHTEHSSNITYKLSKYLNRYQKLYNNADKVIAVSFGLQKRIREMFHVESTVIFNMIDVTEFGKYKNKRQDTFTFVSVGGLIHRKGFDILIDAFSEVSKIVDVKLIIVGDGDLQGVIEKKVKSYYLDDKITMTGRLSRKEIAKLMSSCQVFVLASRGETFGVVYAEAMAAGLPVIATKCGGPESFITDKCGVLIPTNDTESLVGAMLQMYETIDTYDKNEIHKYAVSNFSPSIVACKIMELYKSVYK